LRNHLDSLAAEGKSAVLAGGRSALSGRSLVDRGLAAPFLLLIALYRRVFSPLFGRSCRFHPSCSEYASQAFRRRPFLSACWLTARRLARCHPFHPGGYDPLDPDEDDNGT
jgi:hypothetical protein